MVAFYLAFYSFVLIYNLFSNLIMYKDMEIIV